LFGYLGYWYGTNHSGGFSTISIKDFDIASSDLARDHPGQISRSTLNNNELVYSNKTIGLSFTVPENWFVRDFWPRDAADLVITANTLENQLKANNTEQNVKDQLEISYFDSLAQLDWNALGVVDFEDYVKKYSAEVSSDLEGRVAEPYFLNPEKTVIGNKTGYKAKKAGNENETVYLLKTSKGYFEITAREDDAFDSKMEKEVIKSMEF